MAHLHRNRRGIYEIRDEAGGYLLSTGSRSKRQAQRILDEREGIREAGSITFGMAAANYLAHYRHREICATSHRKQRNQVKRLVSAMGESTALELLTPARVREYVAQEVNRGVSQSSVARALAVLSPILRLAVDDGHLSSNPCSKVRVSKRGQPRERYLTPAEFDTLLELATPCARPWMRFMVLTGCRPGESYNLQWKNVSLTRGIMSIRLERDPFTGDILSVKDGEDRVVSLSHQCVAILQEQRSTVPAHVPWVFPTEYQKRRTTPPKGFLRAVERSGLNRVNGAPVAKCMRVSAVTFRHTFITQALLAGLPIGHVGLVVGHSASAITERYGHLVGSDVSPVVDAVGVIFGNNKLDT